MSIAYAAFRIAEAVAAQDVVCLADDEQSAGDLAAMVRALLPAQTVIFLPSSDALPGDAAPPSPANSGMRVAALRALRNAQQSADRTHIALILSGEAAARRYPAPSAFDSAPPLLETGKPLDMAAFAADVAALGYIDDDRVDEPGEVALRGDVIDIFPADAGMPARIEIADGRIAAIRTYDPVTQRTTDDRAMLEIGRASEPELGAPVAILDHLPPGVILEMPRADRRRQRFVALAEDSARRAGRTADAIDNARWAEAIGGWTVTALDTPEATVPRFAESRSPLAALAKFVAPLQAEGRAFVLAGHSRDLRFLRPKLCKRLSIDLPALDDVMGVTALTAAEPRELRGPRAKPERTTPGKKAPESSARDTAPIAGTVAMPCDAGFVDQHRVVIAAADILGSRALRDDMPLAAAPRWDATSADIRCGDIVIHEDHGVAEVLGLVPAPTLPASDMPALNGAAPDMRVTHAPMTDGTNATGEMIQLGFAKDGRRLVAIDDADRLWRYGADRDAVTLDSLDGNSWEKRRTTIAAAITENAKGLAALAAERATLTAPVIAPDPAAYEKFANGFAFNETADQARAIAAVRDDLASGKPMDRLVVGDVGYGKTEVALRAAALAALAGRQVILAAPTTVLVRQHLESFQKRFDGTGITVAGLSRLSTAAEKKTVKAGLADGSIQIVIGTGAVMAKGVTYKDLALVVIDEEQRFGAADKAKLRGSGETHLLTLSATPIPRTLQMALVGLQQISLITTPPARRQPIRTSLDTQDDGRLRTALLREKSRGGQSFVVVPRIEDMAKLAAMLRRIVPDMTLVEAHGKMPAADIDAAMVGFAAGDGDILLATNIIEAGLDVPRANTMIVWRADRFGLAQLHQLRGRVGRGNRRGQVILLTDSSDAIAERTLKRLRTLAAFDRLGAGFDISAQDLDMRGSGDLLGETQAGHTRLIGTDLYQHLLGNAVRAARGEDVERWTPELNIGASGAFPDTWIPEADIRLSLYVRLARLATPAELDAFEDELTDRFGTLPPDAETLIAHGRIRLAARALEIARIDAGPAAIALTPRKGFAADAKAIGLTAKDGRLLLKEALDADARTTRIDALLEALAA